MIQPTGSPDRLVEEYLGDVARACAGLPTLHRMDLMADLREHIAVARADLPAQTETAVRGILHRLGEPVAIAAEARASAPPVAVAWAPQPLPPPVRRPGLRPGVVAVLVVVPVTVMVMVLAITGLLVGWPPS